MIRRLHTLVLGGRQGAATTLAGLCRWRPKEGQGQGGESDVTKGIMGIEQNHAAMTPISYQFPWEAEHGLYCLVAERVDT